MILILSKLFIRSIWFIDGTLTGTTTSDESGPGSNGSEGALLIPQTTGVQSHYRVEFNAIPRSQYQINKIDLKKKKKKEERKRDIYQK